MIGLSEEERTVWATRVNQWRESGKSAASWCREHKVVYHQLLYWKDRLLSRSQSAGEKQAAKFIELKEPASATGISVSYGDYTVHLTTDFDEVALARCLKTVRGL